MNGLDEKPDRDEVLAELGRVLASAPFKKRYTRQNQLKSLVEQVLDDPEGDIDESSFGLKHFGPDFTPAGSGAARMAVNEIRRFLTAYYGAEGRDSHLRIILPDGSYKPVFERHRPPSPEPVAVPPIPVPPSSAVTTPRPFWKNQLFVAGLLVAIGALLASLYWFGGGHCGGNVAITWPTPGAKVERKEIVTGTKIPKAWWSRCKDYLIVEAVVEDVVGWYNQGRLSDGPNWNLAATFGDANTKPNTRFNVFVLSTTENLKLGLMPISTAGRAQSPPVEVQSR